MATARRDVARNRERILTAARSMRESGEPLQLNAVARHAEVGVGTVYRHFASPEALTEGLVAHRFVSLIALATACADDPDPLVGFRRFLAEALQVYADDAAFAAASVADSAVLDETRAARAELIAAFAVLVERVSPHLRTGLDPVDLMIVVCGLGYSVRLRPERAGAYLEAMLSGVLR